MVAGLGTRLRPLTNDMPKCLTEVHGKAILDNALCVLEKAGVQKTTLVVGYLGHKIIERIGDAYGTMKIQYVENDMYDSTNTSYSLWLALKRMKSDHSLLVLEGDVFFEKKLLIKFMSCGLPAATVVQKYNPQLDGSFVELNQNNVVIDWIHKTARQSLFRIERCFKTVNIHKFDSFFIEKHLIPVLDEHVEKKNSRSAIEFIFQDIVTRREGLIRAFRVRDLKWFEIDDIHDLKIAEEIFK